MIVTWGYRKRGSAIERLDPRTRILGFIGLTFALIQIWDLRIILIFFVGTLALLWLSRLTWRETRRFWIVMSIVVLILTLFTALTGWQGAGVYAVERPIWPQGLTLLGYTFYPSLSIERSVFAVAQLLRIFTLATLSILVIYTTNPGHFGVAVRRLGVPDKFAFATDLAFRFVPTLARDFSTTLDAQKARGYELERKGGLLRQIRNMAPLVVPVTINAIVGADEIVDAMDLRAFGTGPRTWTEPLRYRWWDYAVIAAAALIFVSITTLNLLGYGNFWLPEVFRR
ncbi:MAG TPA: energy-coupling factor transporter transmembrane component T [Herpetosiphonaceae bacterium]